MSRVASSQYPSFREVAEFCRGKTWSGWIRLWEDLSTSHGFVEVFGVEGGKVGRGERI